VAGVHDQYDQPVIVDRVQDSVVTGDPDPPARADGAHIGSDATPSYLG
jgi:hypothetical protein